MPFNFFNDFLCFEKNWVFGSLQTSLLCIVRELAGGGSVAVAVGVRDRRQRRGDRRQMTYDFTIYYFFWIFHAIGSNKRTRREIQCLPLAGFFVKS